MPSSTVRTGGRLIGFGTDRGTVAAASHWDGPMGSSRYVPPIPTAMSDSCRGSGVRRFLLDLRAGAHPQLRIGLLYPRLERAMGVIYRRETELAGHYFDASLPQQFDGLYAW